MSSKHLNTEEYIEAIAEFLPSLRNFGSQPTWAYYLDSMEMHTVHDGIQETTAVLGTLSDDMVADALAVADTFTPRAERSVILRRMIARMLECDHSAKPLYSYITLRGMRVPGTHAVWKRA